MSTEPTLEQIAAFNEDSYVPMGTCNTLAREIIALRDEVSANAKIEAHWADVARKRLDALESAPARGEAHRVNSRVAQARRDLEDVRQERDDLQQQLADCRAALAKISDTTTVGHDGSLMLVINEMRSIAATALASEERDA